MMHDDRPLRVLGVALSTALWNLLGFAAFVGLMLGIAACGLLFAWGAP